MLLAIPADKGKGKYNKSSVVHFATLGGNLSGGKWYIVFKRVVLLNWVGATLQWLVGGPSTHGGWQLRLSGLVLSSS